MSESSITLPAEWAAQDAVMLTWPHRHTDWSTNLSAAETVFTNIARTTIKYEPLIITCCDDTQKKSLYRQFKHAQIPLDNISIYIHETNDSWTRDYGPIGILRNDQVHLLDFEFNGWGKKFSAEKDNQLSHSLHKQGAFASTPFTSLPFVLEGGSIDSDGQGTILTTTRCLLSSTRNPLLNQAAIEKQLKHYLGATRILWLRHGHLQGDDTDSHIDMLARFCDLETIAYSCCEDETDQHFVSLQDMKKELMAFRRLDGNAYKLVPLPIPQAIYNEQGQRLPASYANFLIINQALLVPQYNDPADKMAVTALQSCFPEREVIAINCLAIIQQYGSLHCLTMQLPQGVTRANET